MVTADSEQRLGQTLLQLARTMGKKDRAEHPHRTEDFPRRIVGDGGHDPTKDQLVYAALPPPWADRDHKEHFLIIKEKKLTDYLAQIAWSGFTQPPDISFQNSSILDSNPSRVSLW